MIKATTKILKEESTAKLESPITATDKNQYILDWAEEMCREVVVVEVLLSLPLCDLHDAGVTLRCFVIVYHSKMIDYELIVSSLSSTPAPR
jgi:hypothetical protein